MTLLGPLTPGAVTFTKQIQFPFKPARAFARTLLRRVSAESLHHHTHNELDPTCRFVGSIKAKAFKFRFVTPQFLAASGPRRRPVPAGDAFPVWNGNNDATKLPSVSHIVELLSCNK